LRAFDDLSEGLFGFLNLFIVFSFFEIVTEKYICDKKKRKQLSEDSMHFLYKKK